jgi:hypothetical protein
VDLYIHSPIRLHGTGTNLPYSSSFLCGFFTDCIKLTHNSEVIFVDWHFVRSNMLYSKSVNPFRLNVIQNVQCNEEVTTREDRSLALYGSTGRRCTAGLFNAAPVMYFPGALIYSAGFNVNQNFKKKIFLNNSRFQFFS